MKQAGVSLSEIAAELELEHAEEVITLLAETYKQDAAYYTSDDRMGLLALEMARLEAVIYANWASMQMGDAKSADNVLKAIAMEIKLGRLDTPDTAVNQAQILLVSGQEQDYIAKLKDMADG